MFEYHPLSMARAKHKKEKLEDFQKMGTSMAYGVFFDDTEEECYFMTDIVEEIYPGGKIPQSPNGRYWYVEPGSKITRFGKGSPAIWDDKIGHYVEKVKND